MELHQIKGLILFLLLFYTPCQGFSVNPPPQIHSCPKNLYFLVHRGQIDTAIDLYQQYFEKTQIHDTEFLQQLGLSLLEQGSRNSDPEIQAMSLFGAGIAMNERALPILARGVNSASPQLQLLSLTFLSRSQHDEADLFLLQALQSNYLIIRLEALHQLALKKHPKASSQIESLMGKVEPELLPLFPQLIALVNDNHSTKLLRKLLYDPQEAVRLETIIAAAACGRDDLLPKIRTMIPHASHPQQEAAALALGALQDRESIPRLLQLTQTTNSAEVRLAALQALYHMGITEAGDRIWEIAYHGDLFALGALGGIDGTESKLAMLLQSPQFPVRLNAAIGLLQLKDERCLPLLKEIFIKDSRDLAFTKTVSKGKGFTYWKPVPSARQQFEGDPVTLEISLSFREDLLAACASLPEDTYIEIFSQIFEKQQNDLLPAAVAILESIHSEKTVAFLKKYQQKPGAPFVRAYCNLALYRLGEEGLYSENLTAWMAQQSGENLIQLRPLVPWELDDSRTTFQITPHETSRLLVETVESMTRKQDNNGINCLIEAIKSGNPKNKYALAGLLIRATL